MASLMKRSAVTLVFQLGSQAVSIITGVVLARSLGPAGKGLTAYAVVALAMVTTFFNGQNQAIAYQFGRRRLSFHAVHKGMLAIFAVAAPLCVVVMLAIGCYFPNQRTLVAAAAALPFALYAQFSAQFFLIIGRPQVANIQTLFSTILYAFVVIPLLLWGHADVTVALIVWVASIAAGALYSALHLMPYVTGKRSYSRDIISAEAEVEEPSPNHSIVVRDQFAFMCKSGCTSLAGFLNLRIDVFIVSFMLGAAELGMYTLAVATGELMWKVAQAVIWSALARIASETPERSARLVAKVMRNIFSLQFVFAIIIYIFAPTLIRFFYGAAFEQSATALRFLLPGLTLYTVDAVMGYYLTVQMGKPILRLMVQSGSIVLCSIVTLLTIHRFSIIGAAVATSVSYVCVVIVTTIIFSRQTGIHFSEMYLLQRSDIERFRNIINDVLTKIGIRGLKKNHSES